MSPFLRVGFAVLAAFSVLATAQSSAELADLKKEVAALKDIQTATQKDVAEIKAILLRITGGQRPTPVGGEVSLEGVPMIGPKNAPITIVEFSDFQCPYCRQYASANFPQIQKSLIKAGKVRYAFIAFPLEAIHGQAFLAHEAANCAGDQGKFWEMRDKLFTSPSLGRDQLMSMANAIGLDKTKFEKCFGADQTAAAVRKELAAGERAGVEGTPTFMLGVTTAESKLKVQKVLTGAQTYQVFSDAIDALLARQNAKPGDKQGQ
jgi:protein-disulfide isomerase